MWALEKSKKMSLIFEYNFIAEIFEGSEYEYFKKITTA
jgi:hypothetical protein